MDFLRYKLEGPGGTIVLNSTAEFCRTLGDIPTYGLSGNREEEQELLEFEREMKEEKRRFEEESKNMGAWNQVEIGKILSGVATAVYSGGQQWPLPSVLKITTLK